MASDLAPGTGELLWPGRGGERRLAAAASPGQDGVADRDPDRLTCTVDFMQQIVNGQIQIRRNSKQECKRPSLFCVSTSMFAASILAASDSLSGLPAAALPPHSAGPECGPDRGGSGRKSELPL